jgi:hypothetical protein
MKTMPIAGEIIAFEAKIYAFFSNACMHTAGLKQTPIFAATSATTLAKKTKQLFKVCIIEKIGVHFGEPFSIAGKIGT